MKTASVKTGAPLVASLFLCICGPGVLASDQQETTASVTIMQTAAVTVVNNAPLQTLLQTIAIAPVGVVFSAAGAGPVTAGTTAGATGGGTSGGASGGGSGSGSSDSSGSEIGQGGTGLPGADGASVAGLVEFGGSLTGTTINGDAVSVSVGNVSGGSTAGSGRVPVVIAQYN